MEEQNDNENEEQTSPDISTEKLEIKAESEDEKLTSLQEDLNKARNEYLYLRAEFENYKKHSLKDRTEYLKYGSERLIVELLNVLDNFDLALKSTDISSPEQALKFKQGMELTATEFRSVFKKFGVNELDSHGQAFDPYLHEALGSEESDEIEPGFISKVFKNAYKLHDRLIRPAQVIVAKAKTSHSQ